MTFGFVTRFLALILSLASPLCAQYDLAICTIFQNEAPWLKEWIEFHKIQGVQHFYLYNNVSEDDFYAVLDPYIDKNEVTLVQWPHIYEEGDHAEWIRIQAGAYMDCINHFGSEMTWLACIDSDEFLFSPTGTSLSKFLKDYEEFGGLCVNWLSFGTAGVEDIPSDRLLIEYLIKCNAPNDRNFLVKSIVQPQHVQGCGSAHIFKYKRGKFAVTVDKIKKTRSVYATHILLDQIRINHYWCRTEKYLREFKIPSRQKRRPHHTDDLLLKYVAQSNIYTDIEILQFVPKLLEVMQKQSL